MRDRSRRPDTSGNEIGRRRFIRSSLLTTAGVIASPVGIVRAVSGFARTKSAARRSLSAYDTLVRALLAKMTLEEKLGQMAQAEQSALKDPSDVENYFLGSLLSGGSSDPKAGNSLEAWTDLYDGYQRRALKTRLRIPILYGIDAVHGHSNVLGAVIFPHNIGLGCTRSPALVERAARITAEEVKQMLETGEPLVILDLRHPLDSVSDPRTLPGAIRVLPEEVTSRAGTLPKDEEIILYCT